MAGKLEISPQLKKDLSHVISDTIQGLLRNMDIGSIDKLRLTIDIEEKKRSVSCVLTKVSQTDINYENTL